MRKSKFTNHYYPESRRGHVARLQCPPLRFSDSQDQWETLVLPRELGQLIAFSSSKSAWSSKIHS